MDHAYVHRTLGFGENEQSVQTLAVVVVLLRLSAPEVTMNTKGQARFLGQVAELWSCKQCEDLGWTWRGL